MIQKKLYFSQKYGYTKVSDVMQISSLDSYSRNDLWNYLYNLLLEKLVDNGEPSSFMIRVYTVFLRERVDKIPYMKEGKMGVFENIIFKSKWYVVYNFLEFCYDYIYKYFSVNNAFSFVVILNKILEKNNTGYRMVEGQIVPITDKNEIEAIQQAIYESPYKEITVHITSALSFFSDRTAPDYRNSIKESISAVEVFCRKITEESTLDRALRKLQSKGLVIPNILKESMEKLYHFTNGKEGIRHALMEDSKVGKAEAYFMLIACSSFINYLKTKMSGAK